MFFRAAVFTEQIYGMHDTFWPGVLSHLKFFKINAAITTFVKVAKYLFYVLLRYVIGDTFEEEDDFSQRETFAAISVDLPEHVQEFLFPQLWVLHGCRLFDEWQKFQNFNQIAKLFV